MLDMKFRQYSHALVATLALFMSTAAANILSPWQVTGLATYSPSGRPGTSLDYYIRVNISNPHPAQNVYCSAVWVYPDVPYNHIFECNIVDTSISRTPMVWTLEPLEAGDESPWPTTNFDLRWRAGSTSTLDTDGETAILTGVGQFEVGKNMQGTCAASGFCSWGLKPESKPVSISVNNISCQGTLDEALHDTNCK